MDLRGIGVAVATLLVVTVATPLSAAPGPSQCAAVGDLAIIVGTGAWLTDVEALNGTNHIDWPIPDCSDGTIQRIWAEDGSADAIKYTKICSKDIVRIYAVEGTANLVFAFEWKYEETKGCSLTEGGTAASAPAPLGGSILPGL